MNATLVEAWDSFVALQLNWKGDDVRLWMIEHTDVPIFILCGYLALVFWGPTLIDKPVKLKPFFALWNLLLAVFSMFGAYYTIPQLINNIATHGFKGSICNSARDSYFDGHVGFFLCLFILSKIPELMDTVFLVIQKKDVIFLHWFHHATVMLFCWHSYVTLSSTGLWFGAMNYGVHSIMYTYYFFTAVNLRSLVKPFAQFITALQIAQMVVGLVVTVFSMIWSDSICNVNAANVRLGLAMYLAYFVLFAQLFKKLYLTPKTRVSTNTAPKVKKD